MRFNSCYRFAWPLVIGLFLHSSARAQFTSNVQGFVLDPSGAVVAGATVSLRNADTGVQNATKTGDGGNYRFSSLLPGNYVMSVEASGFKKTEVSFALSTGETQGIDVHLPVATAAAAMSVSAEAMTLNVDESRIQATLSAETVRENNHLPWLGEQGNLQFRFDFLNVFNHVNLGSVDNSLADATFGRVTSALSPRQIQLGLRISF